MPVIFPRQAEPPAVVVLTQWGVRWVSIEYPDGRLHFAAADRWTPESVAAELERLASEVRAVAA